MKITSCQVTTLGVPEDDPLANMPEEAGRMRPIVILRLRTDQGIEGIGLTFYGAAMTGSLRVAVEELCALIVGHDPLRIEHERMDLSAMRAFPERDVRCVCGQAVCRLQRSTGAAHVSLFDHVPLPLVRFAARRSLRTLRRRSS